MSEIEKTTEAEIKKKKRGRPKASKQVVAKTQQYVESLEVTQWEQFEKLCGYQCTSEEIADFFRLEEEQLFEMVARKFKKPFDRVYKTFSAPGLCSLRRSQFVLAKSNSSMAIHLGKIYLGQIDPALTRAEVTVDRLTSVLEQIDEETKRTLAAKDDLHGSFF